MLTNRNQKFKCKVNVDQKTIIPSMQGACVRYLQRLPGELHALSVALTGRSSAAQSWLVVEGKRFNKYVVYRTLDYRGMEI